MTWWKHFFSTTKVKKNPDNLTELFLLKRICIYFFVNKLILKIFSFFFLEKEQTNPKQIQVPDTDELEEEDDTELTKPKTLSGALGMGSNSRALGMGSSSRPETSTDSDLPALPDRVGTSLCFSNEDDTSRGTTLPVRVGTSLPPISNGSSCLSTNLNESNTSLPLPDQVRVTLSNAEETDQTTANTERMRGVDILNTHGNYNTAMVEELGEQLDATIERSLHRNDSTFYQGQYYNILCILKNLIMPLLYILLYFMSFR